MTKSRNVWIFVLTTGNIKVAYIAERCWMYIGKVNEYLLELSTGSDGILSELTHLRLKGYEYVIFRNGDCKV